MYRRTTTTTPTTTPPKPTALSNDKALSIFNEKDRNDKLNSILLAYKSSRTDNEDIVDTWLKSLMSDMSSTSSTTKQATRMLTRPVMVRKTLNWATAEMLKAYTTTTPVEETTKSRKYARKRKNGSKEESMEEENVCEGLDDGVFVRDPSDCSSFFTCYLGGSSIKTTCGAGLKFDVACSCCNWPTNVSS